MASSSWNETIEERIKRQKEEVLAHLNANSGIVASSCKAAGISRFTFYDWCKKDPEFKEKVEDVMELQKDFAEALILKKMKDGDTTMLIFYAKTKMKDRGYVERQEVTGADGTPLAAASPGIDLTKLTDEQRSALLAIGEQVLNDTEH